MSDTLKLATYTLILMTLQPLTCGEHPEEFDPEEPGVGTLQEDCCVELSQCEAALSDILDELLEYQSGLPVCMSTEMK